MLVLIIGGVCAYAAHRATEGRGLPARLALAFTVTIAAVVILQLWLARDAIRQYRFSLLGLRYAVPATEGSSSANTLRIGGDYEAADVYVAGAGARTVAEVRATGDSVRRVVEIRAVDDAASAVMVRTESFFGGHTRVLGARPLAETDTVLLPAMGGLALVVEARGIPLRRTHRVRVAGSPRSVTLPAPNRNWRDRIVRQYPGPLQRTYPLADILEGLGESSGDDISSFFFYDEGQLSFADLDSEVRVSGPAAAAIATLWSTGGRARRITVAGLPFRDYPDVDLVMPERYGLRPLRAGLFRINGSWLDFGLSLPEVRSFDASALAHLSLDSRTGQSACAASHREYRILVSPVRQSLTRQAVTFAAPPRRFESASQAVVSLPCHFAPGTFRILSPSGPVDGRSGIPFTVGDGQREVILRVDAKRASFAGLMIIFVVLVAPALLFSRIPVSGLARALAVCATGLVGVRLLLGMAAAVEYPFLQEASQTGLWFAALLPWAVLLAGMVRDSKGFRPAWAAPAQLAYGILLTGFAAAVFMDSPAKVGVLSVVSIGLAAVSLPWSDRTRSRFKGSPPWLWVQEKIRGASPLEPRGMNTLSAPVRVIGWSFDRWPGATSGAGLFMIRVLLATMGMSEAIEMAGTRIGISVFYTPVSLALLVHVAARHERYLRTEGQRESGTASSLADLWAYLFFAFIATAALISDLGMALTTLPGALVFLLLLADRWSPPAGRGWRSALRPRRVALALPLALFVLLQAQPQLALPAGDPSQPQFRMQQWSTNSLRLLERGDPDALQLIGQRRSEALGAMSETMRAYTRGPFGGAGYFRGKVSPELRATATQEHVVSALLVSQWGFPGAAGLVLLLTAFLAPICPWWREITPNAGGRATATLFAGVLAVLLALSFALPQSGGWRLATLMLLLLGTGPGILAWVARDRGTRPDVARDGILPTGPTVGILYLLTVCGAGIYMVLANYDLVLFTGKNVYGLGLDSIGDMLETLVLLGLGSYLLSAPPSPETAK